MIDFRSYMYRVHYGAEHLSSKLEKIQASRAELLGFDKKEVEFVPTSSDSTVVTVPDYLIEMVHLLPDEMQRIISNDTLKHMITSGEYVLDGKRKIKAGKYIMGAYDRLPPLLKNQDCKKLAASIASFIGVEHNDLYSQKKKCIVSSMTEDFLKLGHYGFDAQSCFRSGGQNEQHKLMLALMPNSFVGYRCAENGERVARFWGVVNDGYVTVSNFYGASTATSGLTVEVAKMLLGTDRNPNKLKFPVQYHGLWQNRDVETYTMKEDKLDPTLGTILFRGYEATCSKCGTRSSTLYYGNRDVMCESCYDDTPKCNICQTGVMDGDFRVAAKRNGKITIDHTCYKCYYIQNHRGMWGLRDGKYYLKDQITDKEMAGVR